MSQQNFKIIYILGAGRSGSTLLSIVLGNSKNVFNAGELIWIPKLEFNLRDKNIEENVKTLWYTIIKRTFTNLKISFTALRKMSYRIESHQRFFINLLYFSKTKNKLFSSYNYNLFEEIANSRNAKYIIDGSKYPGRALFLNRVFKKDVFFVYLKRNPISVVNSFAKKNIEQDSKNFIQANLYYFVINMYCKILSFIINKKQFTEINYEELVKEPEYHLKKISLKFGVCFEESINKARNSQPFSTGRMYDGNRVRKKSEVFIQLQKESNQKKQFRNLITKYFNSLWY